MSPEHVRLVLDECRAPFLGNVYILGSCSRGITFVSQQTRALNLVSALSQSNLLPDGAKVAVVGGGICGITCAAALSAKGVKYSIFELTDEPIALQAQSSTRHVHPNAHFWPDPRAGSNSTALPFLNWTASNANDVRMQILRGWEQIEPKVEVQKGYAVSSVYREFDQATLTFRTPRWSKKDFDIVILAVGFGTEETGRSRPYWEPDGLDYRKSSFKRTSWLISGCGDGGLIDLFRLRFKDFSYGEFIEQLLKSSELEDLAGEVKRIESMYKEKPSVEARGQFLYEEYIELARKYSEPLKQVFDSSLRNDTFVNLVSNTMTPFGPYAMPINRLILAFLLEHDSADGFEFHKGRCLDENITGSIGRYKVGISDTLSSKGAIDCDDLLFRHGPVPVLRSILPKKDYDALRARFEADSGPSLAATEQLWSEHFYDVITPNHVSTPAPVPSAVFASTSSSTVDPSFEYSKRRIYCGSVISTLDGEKSGVISCFVSFGNNQKGFLTTAHAIDALDSNDIGRPVAVKHTDGQDVVVGSIVSFIELHEKRNNSVDVALVRLEDGVEFTQGFGPWFDLPALKGVRDLSFDDLGTRTVKAGRSGVSSGWIQSVGINRLNIMGSKGVEFSFIDVFAIGTGSGAFAAPGDSGSLVFDGDGNALGILFASNGQTDGAHSSYAFPLSRALDYLQCKFIPAGSSPKEHKR